MKLIHIFDRDKYKLVIVIYQYIKLSNEFVRIVQKEVL